MTPQQKRQKIKRGIDMHRFPTLTNINKNLEKMAGTLSKEMDDKLVVTWDPTLENSVLSLNFNLGDEADLSYVKSFFNNKKNHKLIVGLLEKIKHMS